eukprot:363768-Chlamydomonas_euryale.AAC.1
MRAAEELQHGLRSAIDSVHNVLVALFLTSIALVISPRFVLSHIAVLAVSTAVTMGLKAGLVAATVSYFGTPWHTSLAVGLTMAHVGEFSFVLLSTSAQLDILPPQVRALLACRAVLGGFGCGYGGRAAKGRAFAAQRLAGSWRAALRGGGFGQLRGRVGRSAKMSCSA